MNNVAFYNILATAVIIVVFIILVGIILTMTAIIEKWDEEDKEDETKNGK
jgi:Na+-transporting methylmalonyl-CoA/oxaloacetate decarboxylase gamma subunit